MNMILKCRIQNLAIIFSFLSGILLTLSVIKFEQKCDTHSSPYSHHSLRRIKPGVYDLIILIISSPTNGDRRQVIRETWLQFDDKLQYDAEIYNFRMKHYFVIGSINLNADTILHLSTEQSVNNDLLFLNLKDEYSALTSKVLNSLTWLNEQYSNKNFDYNFMLKCDDDTFVRIDVLAKEIISMRSSLLKDKGKPMDKIIDILEANSKELSNMSKEQKQITHLYWGYFNGDAKIKMHGKWKETEWIYCDRYVPYALGGGYILSSGLVTYIAKNANNLKLLKSEDVSVGLWLAPVANIERKHDVRFDTEWTSRGCKNTHVITHKHSIEDMRTLYKNIENTGNLCKEEFTRRSSYEYNWNVLPSQCCQRNEENNMIP